MDKKYKDIHVLNENDEEIFVQSCVTSIIIKESTIEVDNDDILDLHLHKFIVLSCQKGMKIIID